MSWMSWQNTFLLLFRRGVSATTNPATRIYSRSGAVLRENRTAETLRRRGGSILDKGLDGCYDTQGVLGKIMRRRLEVFIPIVLLSILVQMVAPIAAFRMVAFAASDPALAASICHDSAASADTQTAPGETQHDHGICCVRRSAAVYFCKPAAPLPARLMAGAYGQFAGRAGRLEHPGARAAATNVNLAAIGRAHAFTT